MAQRTQAAADALANLNNPHMMDQAMKYGCRYGQLDRNCKKTKENDKLIVAGNVTASAQLHDSNRKDFGLERSKSYK